MRLRQKAAELINNKDGTALKASVEGGNSVIGGGSLPGRELPTRVVAVRGKKSPAALHRAFLNASTPVLGRINKDSFILDVRTVLDEKLFLSAIGKVLCRLKGD